MTDLRTAAQQALEYMKSIGQMDMYPEDWAIVGRLEAALAQQAEPVEPVATVTECEACFTPDVCQLRGTCDYYTASQMRIAAPPQQAEPVEPVAWVGDPSTQDYASTVPDTQIADRLARHGIPKP